MIQNFTLFTTWGICAALFASPAQAAPEPARPNILIMLADDLGYADLGVQGCTDVPTPHIDSIAKSGVRFTSGYGQLKLKELTLVPQAGTTPQKVKATLDGKPVAATVKTAVGRAAISFDQTLVMPMGQTLAVILE